MSDMYDKERTAALIKEARQITADLKVETEKLRIEMTKVLDGDKDEFLHVAESEGSDGDFSKETRAPKASWRFWR